MGGLCYTLSPDNAMECVVHGCDVLNKRGFARPYVLSEHTLVVYSAKETIFCPWCSYTAGPAGHVPECPSK